MDKKEIITRVVEKIKTRYQPQKIILFGSYAWGNPTKDSDLDLLIVKETTEKHRKRSLSIRKILSEENGLIGMDILVYTPEEFSVVSPFYRLERENVTDYATQIL